MTGDNFEYSKICCSMYEHRVKRFQKKFVIFWRSSVVMRYGTWRSDGNRRRNYDWLDLMIMDYGRMYGWTDKFEMISNEIINCEKLKNVVDADTKADSFIFSRWRNEMHVNWSRDRCSSKTQFCSCNFIDTHAVNVRERERIGKERVYWTVIREGWNAWKNRKFKEPKRSKRNEKLMNLCVDCCCCRKRPAKCATWRTKHRNRWYALWKTFLLH